MIHHRSTKKIDHCQMSVIYLSNIFKVPFLYICQFWYLIFEFVISANCGDLFSEVNSAFLLYTFWSRILGCLCFVVCVHEPANLFFWQLLQWGEELDISLFSRFVQCMSLQQFIQDFICLHHFAARPNQWQLWHCFEGLLYFRILMIS